MFIIKWCLAAFLIVFKNPYNCIHCIPWLKDCWSAYEKLIIKPKLKNKSEIAQPIKIDLKELNLLVLPTFLIGMAPLPSTEL